MTALEIAIGCTAVTGLACFTWWFARHAEDPNAGRAAWLIVACLFGAFWFVARLWGFA